MWVVEYMFSSFITKYNNFCHPFLERLAWSPIEAAYACDFSRCLPWLNSPATVRMMDALRFRRLLCHTGSETHPIKAGPSENAKLHSVRLHRPFVQPPFQALLVKNNQFKKKSRIFFRNFSSRHSTGSWYFSMFISLKKRAYYKFASFNVAWLPGLIKSTSFFMGQL